MNAQQKYELTDKLYRTTHDNRLQWEKASQPNNFQITIRNYVLTILLQGEEQDPECVLRINNADGDLIDEIRWSDLKDIRMQDGRGGQAILYRLHELARSNAMGADKALKEISEELDNLPPF
jgi:hypothetical protein